MSIKIEFLWLKASELMPDQRAYILKSNRTFGWTNKMTHQDIALDYSYYLLLCVDQQLIGYMGLHYVIDEFEINTVFIDRQWRKRGYGHLLMATLIEQAKVSFCRRIILEVRSQNKAALQLYERAGFHQLAVRKGYYQNPLDDAYIMEYKLNKKAREADDENLSN